MHDHPANVWFDVGISTEEAASVQAVLEAVRVPARVSEQPYVIVASGDLSYTTPFVVIGTTAASAFIGAVAARARQGAYEAIKRMIGALRAAHASDQGRVDVLIRGDEGPEIVIPSDLPEGALALANRATSSGALWANCLRRGGRVLARRRGRQLMRARSSSSPIGIRTVMESAIRSVINKAQVSPHDFTSHPMSARPHRRSGSPDPKRGVDRTPVAESKGSYRCRP